MRRSTRYSRPGLSGSSKSATLLGADGDGSTLTLDFTTGQLDPRLTFTRTSNATFINSSGFVEWANSNMFRNSVWTSTTLPSGWLANGSNTGTLTYNGDGTITAAGTSQIAWMFPNFPYVQTANGLTYVCSYRVESITGTLTISDILSAGNLAVTQYFIDGSPVATNANVTGPCVVSVSAVASGTQWFPRLGLGVKGNNRTGTIVMSQPHAHPGTAPRQYLANTSTSADNYNTPRFDYDPATLSPRGILIEVTATNLLNWSESFATSGGTNNNWADTNITRNSTNNTDPANATTALRVTASAGNGTIISTAAMGTSAQRTLSIWLRRVSGTGNIQYTLDNGSTYTTQAITSSWVRYTFPATTAAQRVGIRIVTSGDSIELWGAQLEAGSGASSYIPTGASQVTRNTDICNMTGANFSSWFTLGPGTVLVEQDFTKNNTRNLAATISNGGSTYIEMGYRAVGFTSEAVGYVNAGAVTFASSAFVPTINTRYKSAYAWEPGATQLNVCANGTLGTNGSSPVTAAMNRLILGADTTNPAGAFVLNGHIRTLKYWPIRLLNATLQALTT